MSDIFENIVLCNKCKIKMQRKEIIKDGFPIRILYCPKCKNRIYHPHDLTEYKRFNKLKNKAFKVKLRIVGNSYAVSIPKEIIEFISEQKKAIDNFVNLCFEEMGKITLLFKKININSKQKW